jgi:hypothetical protein
MLLLQESGSQVSGIRKEFSCSQSVNILEEVHLYGPAAFPPRPRFFLPGAWAGLGTGQISPYRSDLSPYLPYRNTTARMVGRSVPTITPKWPGKRNHSVAAFGTTSGMVGSLKFHRLHETAREETFLQTPKSNLHHPQGGLRRGRICLSTFSSAASPVPIPTRGAWPRPGGPTWPFLRGVLVGCKPKIQARDRHVSFVRRFE